MNITRNNYEEFFLLYVDNELPATERKAVEEFVRMNTDLSAELTLLKQTVMKPEKSLSFDLKVSLMKNSIPAGLVNEMNCEAYFILYADHELDKQAKAEVEVFLNTNPQYQASFDLYQQVKLEPEPDVIFPDKSLLYRKEKDEKVVPFGWWKLMAAAAVLLAVGIATWFILTNNNNIPARIVHNVPTPTTDKPVISTKKEVAPLQQMVEKQSVVTVILHNEKKMAKKDGAQEPALAKVTTKKKNVEEPRNIVDTPVVVLQENAVVKTEKITSQAMEKNEPNRIKPQPAATVTSFVNNNTAEAGQSQSAIYGDDDRNNDIIYVANTAVNKKNKLRGLLRKASRFIEKATNIEPGSRGIRVANIEIAQK